MTSPQQRGFGERFRRNVLWIGLAGLVLGSGPLLVAILWAHAQGDPNPNPIGPGCFAGITF